MDLAARNQYLAWAAECKARAQLGQGFKATYEWTKLAQAWQHLADSGVGQMAAPAMNKLQNDATQSHTDLTAAKS